MRYNVCVRTTYMKDGEEKTKYTKVGAGFKNRTRDGKEAINLLIGPNLLITERTPIVLFEADEDARDADGV